MTAHSRDIVQVVVVVVTQALLWRVKRGMRRNSREVVRSQTFGRTHGRLRLREHFTILRRR